MCGDKKAKLNNDFFLRDHNGSKIFHKKTGITYHINKDILKFLKLFSKYVNIDQVISQIVGDQKNSTENVIDTVKYLLENNILQIEGQVNVVDHCVGALERVDKTMFSCPYREIEDIHSGEIVFIGIPYDLSVTGYPGARYAPEKIRELSTLSYTYQRSILDECIKKEFPNMVDIGDIIHFLGEDTETFYSRIQKILGNIYKKNATPIILGGDHSITYATFPRYKNKDNFLVHIDAHSDLAEWNESLSHHHGNVLTRLKSENLLNNLFQLGIRVSSNGEGCGIKNYYKNTYDFSILKDKDVFISLDIDVLDPSICPGTGTPEPNGMSLSDLYNILREIKIVSNTIGFEIVEVSPLLDRSNITSLTAVRIILEFLSY